MKRLANLLGAAPLIAWYGWSLFRDVPVFIREYRMFGAGYGDALLALQALAQLSAIAFTSFVIILLLVRDVPRARAHGLAPFAAAMIGTFAIASFLLLPPVALTLPLLALSAALIILGLGASLYALVYLGRSFAILPGARRLIIGGPYRFIRHPLYLFEEIAVLGLLLQFLSPWSALIALVHGAAQLVRMHYEENALAGAFPEYVAYAARTARLIPDIY